MAISPERTQHYTALVMSVLLRMILWCTSTSFFEYAHVWLRRTCCTYVPYITDIMTASG